MFIRKKKVEKAIFARMQEISRLENVTGKEKAKYARANLIGLITDLNLSERFVE